MQPVIAQQSLVHVHEMRLPDGRERLERGHVGRALGEVQRLQAAGDRAAADDDDGMTGCL